MKEGKIKMILIQGDCLKVLPTLPDNSVDLVLTDPPYNIDFEKYNSLTDRGRHFHYTEELKWNTCDLKEISKVLFGEFDRIVKESGSVIIFAPQEWAYYYYEPAIKNNFDFKCQIIWIKDNPIPQIRHKNYRSAHENIIWFARKKEKCPFTFNFTTQQEMKNVFNTPSLTSKENLGHPTQKPEKVIERLMKVHSNKGDTVLDPFLGSGTTMKVARDLKRSCIGIEINPKYIEICKKRLNWGSSLSDKIEFEFKDMSNLK
jgi:site-specific DNA-methyltransferase (adenine-specific)/modification methylase